VRVQNLVIDVGAVVFVGRSRCWLLVGCFVAGGCPRCWVCPGLLVLTWLAIGVHVHGWVTAFDAPTASWIGNSVHRSHGLDEASLITVRLGNPVTVAVAGLIGGALLAWRARSLRPGVVVIGAVAGLCSPTPRSGRSFTAH
jgi:hypothetical protein